MKKAIKYKIQDSRFKKGFTLIELLIVIAIIGILATLLMSNFIGIRQRARDGKRKSDISQMQAALEQYRSDNGSYPLSIPSCNSAFVSPGCGSGGSNCVVYEKVIPCDPLQQSNQQGYNNGNYYYTTPDGGSSYQLGACLENASDPQGVNTSPGGSGCSSGIYYVATNP